jgi:two-component system, chemotaxis family, sensor histidine kinase and response regulator WspE
MSGQEDFSVNKSMFDMFQTETETQIKVLRASLSILTDSSADESSIENAMRAALSIKGAAQLVKIQLALKLSSVLEDFFIFVQSKNLSLNNEQLDVLNSATEYLSTLAKLKIEEHENPEKSIINKRDKLISKIKTCTTSNSQPQQEQATLHTETDINIPHDIDPMMFDLFKTELENNILTMSDSLLTLESNPDNDEELERLMRSSHSIKGAARLLELDHIVKLAHILEDCFVAAQNKTLAINTSHIDLFLQCIDIFKIISQHSITEHIEWIPNNISNILDHINKLSNIDNISNPDKAISNNDTDEVETMSFNAPKNLDPTMLELFKTELENNIDAISNSLLELENDPKNTQHLEQLMRASHSIKGAARLLDIEIVVKLAHIMEDCFVAAQNQTITISNNHTDTFLQCIDALKEISSLSAVEHESWTYSNSQKVSDLISNLQKIEKNQDIIPLKNHQTKEKPENSKPLPKPSSTQKKGDSVDSVVRVSAKRINKLMGLAGELTVTSNWVRTHTNSMLGLKKKHNELIDSIDRLRVILEERQISDLESDLLSTIQHKASNYRDNLTQQIIDLDDFDRRGTNLSSRINHEIISSRMRPFKDSTQGYKRMVRDISRSLNKKIKLEIIGEDTQVDREILEKIEAPVNHMIRNAIDHGIEMPNERSSSNKSETGTIQLKASHNAGRLSITVADDGRGVDIENIRQKVLEKKLVSKNMSESLSKSELLDFLFLPAFSTRDSVTEISGRGVGLDVVHSALQEMRGKLHSHTELGKGMSINMELPLTLSVIRSLLVKVNKELYAFPLAGIHNLITIKKTEISILEDKQYITLDGNHIGLIHTAQILGVPSNSNDNSDLSVIIVGDWNNLYGLVVDEMIGERGLALRPLDPRLGKVKDINSSALTDGGEPILVFDIDDLIQSIQGIISGKNIAKIGQSNDTDNATKRILVVDDSLTVREVEKKLLESRGYYVDIAIDGVDAWNTVRNGNYDLVVSDVDMPRMNGIELVSLIKNDAALRNMPVMMVSYKDRPEDKQKGLEAGADYYLTKGSFHDETLIDAVRDLIGDPI